MNKNDQLQYYVIQLENQKRIIVYKEDVLLFDSISLEELQLYDKIWKQKR
ncbi:unnamed protein product (macronuclear) [Paramecium tetraurelia]|uniref:Uncharacterized protein n=1 Tax=Paramecium tetraurelia TaxID=5888 RepID=A0DM17_PARTE|nr:uncharacterized protein GSPATT00018302001 [Paramecium tetraurelia]CAK84084.1 unnamed protein product [Paramecium tetraurelia]|eukprot:XP_001451481.1 hypothetical protein (macronuclear) [Paramecium tetraurelia strain d4-2]